MNNLLTLMSTVIQLVQRFYDAESGHVTLGGKDLSSYNLRWLRQQVGVVEQEPVLFDATIGANIAHGLVNSKATQAEIEAAAKVCFLNGIWDNYNSE